MKGVQSLSTIDSNISSSHSCSSGEDAAYKRMYIQAKKLRKAHCVRQGKIENYLKREVGPFETIRWKYLKMNSKELSYDPNLFSPLATGKYHIHARLINTFGTDTILLQDPEFVEMALKKMLEEEEKHEEQEYERRERLELYRQHKENALAVRAGKSNETSHRIKPVKFKHEYGSVIQHKPEEPFDSENHLHQMPPVPATTLAASVWEDQSNFSECENIELMFDKADSLICVGSQLNETKFKLVKRKKKPLRNNCKREQRKKRSNKKSITKMKKRKADNFERASLASRKNIKGKNKQKKKKVRNVHELPGPTTPVKDTPPKQVNSSSSAAPDSSRQSTSTEIEEKHTLVHLKKVAEDEELRSVSSASVESNDHKLAASKINVSSSRSYASKSETESSQEDKSGSPRVETASKGKLKVDNLLEISTSQNKSSSETNKEGISPQLNCSSSAATEQLQTCSSNSETKSYYSEEQRGHSEETDISFKVRTQSNAFDPWSSMNDEYDFTISSSVPLPDDNSLTRISNRETDASSEDSVEISETKKSMAFTINSRVGERKRDQTQESNTPAHQDELLSKANAQPSPCSVDKFNLKRVANSKRREARKLLSTVGIDNLITERRNSLLEEKRWMESTFHDVFIKRS